MRHRPTPRVFHLLMVLALTLGLAASVGAQDAAPAATVVLAVVPATTTVDVGATFTVAVQIQAGAQAVNGAEAHLVFDPNILEVVSGAPGTALALPLVPLTFDNVTGTAQMGAGTVNTTPPSGTFDLLTLTFRAKAPSPGTVIELVRLGVPRQSDVTGVGYSVLASVASAIIIVNAPPAPPTETPTPLPEQPTETPELPTSTPLPDVPTSTPLPATPVPTGPLQLRAVTGASNVTAGTPVPVDFVLEGAAAGVYAVEVACSVAGNVANVQTVSSGGLFAPNPVVINNFSAGQGSWIYAVSQSSDNAPVTSDGSVFSVLLNTIGGGDAALSCLASAVVLDGSEIGLTFISTPISVNAPLPTETPTSTPEAPTPTPEVPTVTPEEPTATPEPPTATPEPPTATPELPTATPEPTLATISGAALRSHGPDSGIVVKLLASDGTVAGETQTADDGSFSFTAVVPGDYLVTAEALGHLSATGLATAAAGQVLNLGTATLVAGDLVTGDNVIDELDVVQLVASYGQTVPPAPGNADLNLDGRVGILDLRALAVNLRKTGPVLFTPPV